jgi:two-component system, cell cycle sensor histidine kinase and response regulator CckA
MPRVLLVEDENHIRLLVHTILKHKGYQVVEATNGADALAVLRRDDHFDAVLTDLRMPKMDGRMFLKELKRHYKHIPVVVISAYASADWATDAVNESYACLRKPFTHDQLVDTVDQAVAH